MSIKLHTEPGERMMKRLELILSSIQAWLVQAGPGRVTISFIHREKHTIHGALGTVQKTVLLQGWGIISPELNAVLILFSKS